MEAKSLNKLVVTASQCLLTSSFLLIFIPRDTNAQLASSTNLDVQRYDYTYMNGGNLAIESITPAIKNNSLNRISRGPSGNLAHIKINGVTLIDQKPEKLIELEGNNSLYSQEANELESLRLDLSEKTHIRIKITGSTAGYSQLGGALLSSDSRAVNGESMSIFPTMSPSVFRLDALQ